MPIRPSGPDESAPPPHQDFRVGVDGHVLDGKYQGTRTWLHELLLRVPALLPRVEFVLYTGDPAAHTGVYDAPNVVHRRLPRLPSPVRIAAYWPVAILRDRLDLLLTQYISPLTHPRRQVVVVHDVLFETHPEFFPPGVRRRNRLLVGRSARSARQVVTVSEYSRTQIGRVYGLDPADVAVVRNGVTLPAPDAPPAGAPELPAELAGLPYVLMVGRLEPRKNLRLALTAFARVADPRARLVVVGRDDFEDPVTLAALAADPRAVHLEDVPRAQLDALYRHAAALVYPSLGEGWGIPVTEALVAGVPVIASSRTAIPEAGGPVTHYADPLAPDAEARWAQLVEAALAGRLAVEPDPVAAHLAGLTWDRSAADLADVLRRLQDR